MHKTFFCLLLLLAAFWPPAPARETKESLTNQLVDGSQSTWVYGGFSSYLEEGKCSGSDQWTFHRNGLLVVRKCKGKSVVTEEKLWDIVPHPEAAGILMLQIKGRQVCTKEPDKALSMTENFNLSIGSDPKSSGNLMLIITRPQPKGIEKQKCYFTRPR